MNAVDTNVLVYAYDESSPEKRGRARELLTSLSDTVLLWQVACEFISASRKTLGPGGDPAAPWERLTELRAAFPLIVPTPNVLDRAAGIQKGTRAQFWDCMIYAACQEAGVTRLYSEDLPGAAIQGLSIVNPFAG
jgi:predicted nucleic acid-binding protein